ncbi:transposase [Kitasatospora sp. NPDC004723]|uniref:transposase n=1 Tax=Kitasatospora sp. NPDC004723 TaxID=3154288 RepID=UPI0033AAAF70
MREILNAILDQARTGCQWCYLPHDPPPPSAVYYSFGTWRDDGTAGLSTTCCAGRSVRAGIGTRTPSRSSWTPRRYAPRRTRPRRRPGWMRESRNPARGPGRDHRMTPAYRHTRTASARCPRSP